MNKAAGTFEVKINPLPPYNTSTDAKLARMSIDKQFHGDLDATSQGHIIIDKGKHSYEFQYGMSD